MLNTRKLVKPNISGAEDIKTAIKSDTKTDIKTDIKTAIKSDSKVNQQPVILNNNINITPSSVLIVEHIESEFKFIIKNNKNTIGFFTVGQLFKYINSDIENYLINIDLTISVDIIAKYLCSMNDTREYVLISHLESPITGNIDILVKLYSDIVAYESKIQSEYEHLNEVVKKNVMNKNRMLVYNILSHIIKLFAIQTSANSHNETTRELILKYTIGAQYKLSTMIQEDMTAKLSRLDTILEDYNNICLLRENIKLRMNKLELNMNTQSEKINLLLGQLEQLEQLDTLKMQSGGTKSGSNLSKSTLSNLSESFTFSKSSNQSNQSKQSTPSTPSTSSESGSESEGSESSNTTVTKTNITSSTLSNLSTLPTETSVNKLTGGMSSSLLSSYVPKNKNKHNLTRHLSSYDSNTSE